MDYSFEKQKLFERAESKLLRSLSPRQGLDFCSNDYLGFAEDKKLIDKIFNSSIEFIGSAGSRLIRGNHSYLESLELQLAQISKKKSALFFPSGYQCNLGVLSALLQQDDLVYSDELNHASIIDGLKLVKSKKIIYKHNDLNHLESLLKTETSKNQKWLVTESVFSMDGDSPDLVSLARLCQAYNVRLIVDEAHATGIYGNGGGLVVELNLQEQVMLTTHMAGKAWGVSGAWVSCDEIIKEYLVNFSRPFIYSTAPSAIQVQSLISALQLWTEVGEDRVDQLKSRMKKLSSLINGEQKFSPIFPLLVKSIESGMALQSDLQNKGYDVRLIRYPTVSLDKPRLRITIPGIKPETQVDQFIFDLRLCRENLKC